MKAALVSPCVRLLTGFTDLACVYAGPLTVPMKACSLRIEEGARPVVPEVIVPLSFWTDGHRAGKSMKYNGAQNAGVKLLGLRDKPRFLFFEKHSRLSPAQAETRVLQRLQQEDTEGINVWHAGWRCFVRARPVILALPADRVSAVPVFLTVTSRSGVYVGREMWAVWVSGVHLG